MDHLCPLLPLPAAIYMFLMISHFESSMYLYSIMRAFQTIIGVPIIWFIIVMLLPYSPRPGTLGYWLMEGTNKTSELRLGSCSHPSEQEPFFQKTNVFIIPHKTSQKP